MPRKISREAMDDSRANCKGLNTDFFYLEEEYLKQRSLKLRQVRRICFGCPIRQQCLEIGFAFERFGMWGGVTGPERTEIYNKKHDSAFLNGLKRDLEEFGITYEEVVDASDVERKML